MYYVCTLVRLIMTCNIVVGKIMAGINMAELPKKLPNLTRHYFTCSIILPAILQNSTQFCSFKVKKHLKLKDFFQENQRIINT